MARGSFDPEIKQSIEKPAPRKSVPQRRPGGNKPKPAASAKPADNGNPQAATADAGKVGIGAMRPGGDLQPQAPQAGNQGHSPAHAAMAASIAHAILQRGGG